MTAYWLVVFVWGRGPFWFWPVPSKRLWRATPCKMMGSTTSTSAMRLCGTTGRWRWMVFGVRSIRSCKGRHFASSNPLLTRNSRWSTALISWFISSRWGASSSSCTQPLRIGGPQTMRRAARFHNGPFSRWDTPFSCGQLSPWLRFGSLVQTCSWQALYIWPLACCFGYGSTTRAFGDSCCWGQFSGPAIWQRRRFFLWLSFSLDWRHS